MLPLSNEVIKNNNQSKNALPIEILESIHKMNDYNPRVYPPFKGCGISFDYYHKIIDSAYATFTIAAGDNIYDGVIIIPRIRTGGTDKLLKSYLHILSQKLGLNILIICEDLTRSDWTDDFEEMASVIYLDKIFQSNIPPYYRIAAISYYLTQNKPKFIWGFNSRLAYLLIATHGEVLCKHTDIWIVCFAHWIHEISYREFGMIHDYILRCKDYIKYIISDNSVFIDTLKRQYNLDRDMLIHLPSPNSDNILNPQPIIKRRKLRVLWASGIEWNKGIDTLIKIATVLKEKNIDATIDVYGTPKNNNGYKLLEDFKKQTKNLNNIFYRNTFNDFSQTSPQNYDVFLFTSLIEGMPNILLEAAEHKMFIISSNVGGIKDLIRDGHSGFLIQDSFNSLGYVDKLIEVMEMKNEDYNKIRENLVTHYNSMYTLDIATKKFKKIIA